MKVPLISSVEGDVNIVSVNADAVLDFIEYGIKEIIDPLKECQYASKKKIFVIVK